VRRNLFTSVDRITSNTTDDSKSIEEVSTIAKNQNTFAKRKREMEKRAKAEAKRIRRTERKLHPVETEPTAPIDDEATDEEE